MCVSRPDKIIPSRYDPVSDLGLIVVGFDKVETNEIHNRDKNGTFWAVSLLIRNTSQTICYDQLFGTVFG